jgi:hypothetical protein
MGAATAAAGGPPRRRAMLTTSPICAIESSSWTNRAMTKFCSPPIQNDSASSSG